MFKGASAIVRDVVGLHANSSAGTPAPMTYIKQTGLQIQCGFAGLLFSLSFRGLVLSTETKSLDDGTIALYVAVVEIVEQATALTYQAGQRASGGEVLVVLLHVLSEVGDTVGEQCNLAFGRAGVSCSLAILAEDLFLFCFV